MVARQLLRRLDAHFERGNQLMSRIDEHMARGNQLMGRIDEHMARGNQLMGQLEKAMVDISREVALTREEVGRSREEVRLSRESRVDMREFMRETFLRSDKRAQDQAAALQEVRQESKAHTQALFRLIDRMDRLDPGGSAAAG